VRAERFGELLGARIGDSHRFGPLLKLFGVTLAVWDKLKQGSGQFWVSLHLLDQVPAAALQTMVLAKQVPTFPLKL